MIKETFKKFALTTCFLFAANANADAHPHVWVEANMEVVLNEKGEFTELRHVWRFDEIFSSTLIIDFDANLDGKLDETEINEITSTVQKSIADFDFYTALRSGNTAIEFYEPEKINAYYDNDQMIMFFSINPSKPYSLNEEPLRISASDTTYYVEFTFSNENVTITGEKHDCIKKVVNPDFDALYADNAQTLSEAFFNDENQVLNFGDEYYSWAHISCKS